MPFVGLPGGGPGGPDIVDEMSKSKILSLGLNKSVHMPLNVPPIFASTATYRKLATTPHPRYHPHQTQRSFSDQPEKSACPLKHHQQEKHSQAQSCVVLLISNILQGGHTNLHDPLFHRPFDDIPRNVNRFILT